ncbi:MAG: diguanylate cyclase [Gammaproteobacteria bacterium]|nr:diguanylate cyclase [Gammaproteobacteria bacterium]
MTPDRRAKERRRRPRRAADATARPVAWAEQRLQFIMRYFFWALSLAYFNLDASVARSPGFLVLIDGALAIYLLLITLYLLHARRQAYSPARWRLAMWTDLGMVPLALLADSNALSPAYLVFLVVILGNGMRYGMRFFTEAVAGAFLLSAVIVALRFGEYAQAPSMHLTFFAIFGAIFILYAYSLTAKLDNSRRTLEHESALDILTGLLNRRGLYKKADGLFQSVGVEGRSLSVLFADLNRFKAINDRFGHHVGDGVLKQIAQIIDANSRDSDVVSRYGGDEFVILLPDATVEEARMVSQRLQSAVADWSLSNNISLSVSIGLGGVPDDGRDLQNVLKQVDQRMYQGKYSTGNSARPHPEGNGSGSA